MVNRRIRRWPDTPESQGFTPTNDRNVMLAESATLSIRPGSTTTVEQILSDFPRIYVQNQGRARG